jgi:hypothetical protein
MSGVLAEHPVVLAMLACLFAVALALGLVLLRRSRARSRVDLSPAAAMVSPAAMATPAPPPPTAEDVELRVREAEERSDKDALPGLYLELAQIRLADGATSQSEDLLRRSLRVAVGPRFKDVQARARVALGDIAFESGDRSTACEHWQIARALFHELKQSSEHAAVESRMLKNGCPTDWVLTDF